MPAPERQGMRVCETFSLTATALLVGTSACQFDHDVVAAGYYGVTQAGRSAMTASPAATPAATKNPQGPSAATTPSSGAAGTSTDDSARGTAGASNAPDVPSSGQPMPATTGCDLTGRWLVTLHKTTDGLGNLQYAHNYLYYEIEQQGEILTVNRSLHCGFDVAGGGSFAITVDFRPAWPGVMKNVTFDGRTGTSAKAANGCKVSFDKQYMTMGATLPYYLDPATPLPSAEEKASGSTPGWEDWDSDGNPGVTGTCSGTVTGKIFTASREWTAISGTASDVGSIFKLPLQWDQEPNVMAFDGSPFLGSSAVRAADPTSHFAQFARLKAEQAPGDDATICKSIVELAPTLTPEAAGM